MRLFHRYAGVLGNANFRKLWGSQIAVKIGENFFNFTLIILLFDLTASAFVVSLYIALVSLPPILFSAIAGVVADSFDRRTVLIVSNSARLLLVLIALASHGDAAVLIALAVALSVIAQFFGPAEVSSIPTLVEKEHLFLANSYYSFTNYAAFLVGYTVAGVVYHHLGATVAFVCTGSLYALAVALNATLPPLDHHLKTLGLFGRRVAQGLHAYRERLRDGVRFILRHRIVLVIILQVAAVFAIERTVISVIPAYSEGFLGFTVEELSLFIILPTGFGTVAGVLVANRLKHRLAKDRLMTFGLALNGLALLALTVFPQMRDALQALFPTFSALAVGKGVASALAFLSGAADPFIIVPAQTALHKLAPEAERGRVFGALYTVINAVGILPILFFGALTRAVPLPAILLILATVILGTAVAGRPFYRRHSLGVE